MSQWMQMVYNIWPMRSKKLLRNKEISLNPGGIMLLCACTLRQRISFLDIKVHLLKTLIYNSIISTMEANLCSSLFCEAL
jgi:hypothetical protein